MSCSPLGLCATPGSGVLAGLPRFPSFQAAWGRPWGWPCCTSSPPSSGSELGSRVGCSSRSTRVSEAIAVGEKRLCLGSLQLPAMHPYSCSLSQAPSCPAHHCDMVYPPSCCSWPGTALAPGTHLDRTLSWTFVGTHPDHWVSGGLSLAGCTAPASQLGHAPAPPHPLACGPGESRTSSGPVSD